MQRLSLLDEDIFSKDSLLVRRFILDLDEQWPSLKFLGFGSYYAWIWLCYNSGILIKHTSDASLASNYMLLMYLMSTTALAITLIVAAIFYEKSSKLVNNAHFTVIASLIAGISTFFIPYFTQSATVTNGPYLILTALTGFGTAWIALKLGTVYAAVKTRKAIMYTSVSFIFACMLYFVATGLPWKIGIVVMSVLPLFSALFTMSLSEPEGIDEISNNKIIPLSTSFKIRFFIIIFAFSLAVGVTRGYSTQQQPVQLIEDEGSIIAFGTALVSAVIFVLLGIARRNFKISYLFYPAIVAVSIGILFTPFAQFASEHIASFENRFIGVSYSIFIMFIWCLCSHISNVTNNSPIKVFGFGRGASAIGTTIGWLLGAIVINSSFASQENMLGIAIVMVFSLLFLSLGIFNDKTISSEVMFHKHGLSKNKTIIDEPTKGAWLKSCDFIIDEYGLSPREGEVLILLAKGRTIEYAGNELNISFNTAKTHVRNLYAKLNVHSREELIDLVEKEKQYIKGILSK